MHILTLDLLDGKPIVSVAVATQAEAERLSAFMRQSTRLWTTPRDTEPVEETWNYPWEEAPEWAEWAATDADGEAYWFEREPIEGSLSNTFELADRFSRVAKIERTTTRPDWTQSLQKRKLR